MDDDGRMEATLQLGDLVLSDDRTSVRFHLPPLPIDGQRKPLRIHLDFDADMVQQLLERLTLLYVQMVPPHTTSQPPSGPH